MGGDLGGRGFVEASNYNDYCLAQYCQENWPVKQHSLTLVSVWSDDLVILETENYFLQTTVLPPDSLSWDRVI